MFYVILHYFLILSAHCFKRTNMMLANKNICEGFIGYKAENCFSFFFNFLVNMFHLKSIQLMALKFYRTCFAVFVDGDV